MALNINTNIGALMASASATAVNRSMETSMERLSTGLRINSAADDAAGVSISTRMEAQIRGLNQSIRNAGDAQSLVNTAEGAMAEITNMLQRVRELSVQAANGIMNPQDREALNAEVDQLVAEINRVSSDTTFNNQKLLDGTYNAKFQIGMESGQTVGVSINNMSASVLGKEGNVPGATTQITSGSAVGKAATVSKATLALHGADTYSFKVNGTTVASTVDPSNNTSVGNFVNVINANLLNAGNKDVVASVAASGVIEFQNVAGDAIKITNFASAGNGTASFTPIEGAGSARLLNDAGAVSANSAVGKQSGTFGVTLKLEAGGEYSFKINDKQINVASTDNMAAIATKIETALGGTFEAILSTDNATGDAAAEAYRAAYDAANTTVTAQNTMATMFGQAADEIVIYNTDRATASNINITDFSVTDGKENGVQGVVDISSPDAEAHLVDGTAFFQTNANATTKIAEQQLTFTSTSSDYVVKIDGQNFRIQSEKLKDGTAAADLIAKINASTAMNGGRAAAAGLGSLGNTIDGTTATAATHVGAAALDVSGDETAFSMTMDVSLDGGNTTQTVTIANGTNYGSADALISALQTGLNNAFGAGKVTASIDPNAGELKLTTVEKGSGYNITIANASANMQTVLGLNDATSSTGTATAGANGTNGLGNYNYEIVQTGQNITVKKLTNLAASGTSTTTLRTSVEAASATAAATLIAANVVTFGANQLDLFETGDAVKSTTLSGVGVTDNQVYYLRKVSATTATLHLTAKDANDNVNAVTLAGTPAGTETLTMVNGINANPGNNASDAEWYLNAGTPANKTKDTGTAIDLNINTNALHTSGAAEASEMTLEFQGDDTFNMTIEGQAISAAVAGGSVATIIATINANATLQAAGVTAEAVTGNSNAVLLKRADGQSLDITAFSSTNNTDVLTSPGSQQGVVKTLTSKSAVTAADIAAAGLAEKTQATLAFDRQDEVSFTLSDGSTTSTVRFTDTHAGGTTGANLQAELTKALVGSDITATVVVSGNGVSVELLNAKGGKIELSNFQSKGTGTATWRPDTLQGNAVILNDDSAVSLTGKSIADISFSTQDGATEAFGIVDRALQTINDMRSELGAVANRLDHTISNLTNVVINTEGAKSRILDADFAAESTNLAKSQILQQASMAMLAQANASKQSVLSLLQG